MDNVDVEGLTPESEIIEENEKETNALLKLLDAAVVYISEFPWCPPVRSKYLGFGIGGMIGVFLIKFDGPIKDSSDTELWVITGDLPSAYLVTEKAPDVDSALKIYCGLMEDWVRAVEQKASMKNVYPVKAAPTQENATLLRNRIEFIRSEFV